jgi:glucose/mannose-6-phosphate isomerase
MHVLDDPETYARLDPDGLRGRIAGLPQQCRDARTGAKAFPFPREFSQVDRIVVLGMGGSAIAGDILRSLALRSSRKTVLVHRGYDLPPLVDEGTLVIASSKSGDTEETLSSFGRALETPAQKLVMTTGGRLVETARERGITAFTFEYAGEPRSALGHSLMPLLVVGETAGAVPSQEEAVSESIALMEEMRAEIGIETPFEGNEAKQLAERIQGKLPVVYGAEFLAEAAHRWKTQLNENGKMWAFHEELSEANHNAIEGYGLPQEVSERAHVVFLYHPRLSPRIILRYNGTHDALAACGVSDDRVTARGESDLARAMTAIFAGDHVSYYLAMLNGVRPSPVTSIQHLKGWLSQN